MAQKLFEDKIGALSHSVGTITLQPSRLTIGGQQYVTTAALNLVLPVLVANTRYMIYAVQTAGVVSLVQSTNMNSVGPAGYASWKLVGAYYSNYLLAFGSFADINSSAKYVRCVVRAATPTASPTLANNTTSTIIFSTKSTDTENGYNTSNGQYVVSVPGYYDFDLSLGLTGTFATQGNMFSSVRINGNPVASHQTSESGSSSGAQDATVNAGGILLSAGDVITYTMTPSAWASFGGFLADAARNYLTIVGVADYGVPLKDL